MMVSSFMEGLNYIIDVRMYTYVNTALNGSLVNKSDYAEKSGRKYNQNENFLLERVEVVMRESYEN